MIKKTNTRAMTLFAIAASLLGACKNGSGDQAKLYAENDRVFKNIDTTAKPGDDFFLYANGRWVKENPIPGAYSSWGIGNVVQNDLRDKLKKINEDALKADAEKGSNTQKI